MVRNFRPPVTSSDRLRTTSGTRAPFEFCPMFATFAPCVAAETTLLQCCTVERFGLPQYGRFRPVSNHLTSPHLHAHDARAVGNRHSARPGLTGSKASRPGRSAARVTPVDPPQDPAATPEVARHAPCGRSRALVVRLSLLTEENLFCHWGESSNGLRKLSPQRQKSFGFGVTAR